MKRPLACAKAVEWRAYAESLEERNREHVLTSFRLTRIEEALGITGLRKSDPQSLCSCGPFQSKSPNPGNESSEPELDDSGAENRSAYERLAAWPKSRPSMITVRTIDGTDFVCNYWGGPLLILGPHERSTDYAKIVVGNALREMDEDNDSFGRPARNGTRALIALESLRDWVR